MSKALDRPEWQDRANCAGADPDLFFPEHGESLNIVRSICAACPVRDECLDYAVEEGIHHGIWGGKSERERRGMRRRRRVA